MGWVISAIVAASGFLAWFVKVTMANQLADFREGIRKEFGEQFLNAKLADAKMTGMIVDIERIDQRVDAAEDQMSKHEKTLVDIGVRVRLIEGK